MEINIYINCKKTDSKIKSAIDEFIKRLSPYCCLNLLCSKKAPSFSPQKNTYHSIITYADQKAETISSEEYAALLNSMMANGISKICYYIGYSSECPADMNLFSITVPQMSPQLTAVALSEQIYRAYTINHNITYHK